MSTTPNDDILDAHLKLTGKSARRINEMRRALPVETTPGAVVRGVIDASLESLTEKVMGTAAR